MTHTLYRAAAHQAYSTYTPSENPDVAQRTTFVPLHAEGTIERVPYTTLAYGVDAMDIQDFITRYPKQADRYLFNDAARLWQLRQIYSYSAASASRTLVVYIKAGTQYDEPIDVQPLLGESHHAVTHDACIIILEDHARATIVDSYRLTTGTHIRTTICHVGAYAHLSVLYDHHNTDAQITNAHLFRCKRASSTTATYLMQSHGKTDTWFDVQLCETESNVAIRGICVLSGTAHARIMSEQHHTAPNTTSTVTINGCLTERAQALYHGRIHITPAAQGSTAQQRNHTLIASDTAHAISTPSLEALAHQVHCVHASAVGTLDAQALAYLVMRGLTEAQARILLLRGFIHASVGDCDALQVRLASIPL